MQEKKIAHEDHKYLEALVQNNRPLIKEIYSRYAGEVKKIVLKNSGNVQDAEDLFSELLMELCEQASSGKFILTCPFNAFIKMMAFRRWINKINKKAQKKVTLSDMTGYNDIKDTNADESIELFDKEQRQHDLFLRKLQELGDSCRKLLELSWTVKPLQKAAEILNVTYAYMRKRKSICMKKLVEMIKDSPEYIEIRN